MFTGWSTVASVIWPPRTGAGAETRAPAVPGAPSTAPAPLTAATTAPLRLRNVCLSIAPDSLMRSYPPPVAGWQLLGLPLGTSFPEGGCVVACFEEASLDSISDAQ